MSTNLTLPPDDEIESFAEQNVRPLLRGDSIIATIILILVVIIALIGGADVVGIFGTFFTAAPVIGVTVGYLHNERKKRAIRELKEEHKKRMPQPPDVIDGIVEPKPPLLPTIPGPIHDSRMPTPDLFVGRKKLLVEIWKKLRKSDERNVLTLWGIGGVGKSALAIQVMKDEEVNRLFPDGRYWLDVRGGDAAAAIRGLLVREFDMGGVQLPSALNEVVALLHGQVRSKKVLLVMDNAESLATTPAEIRKIVRQIVLPLPGMTLVTSRVEIDRLHDVEVDVLETGDGVELLAKSLDWSKAERARETADAEKLVNYLKGLALALRITASRMSRRQQSCATALVALEKEPILNTESAEGEKTLGQTFALSYKDLQEPLRTLFHFLGVCAVSGARVAALTEMLGWSGEEVETTIDGMVERSLADRTDTRVELHPLLHQFALECARQDKNAYEDWVRKHVAYYGYKIGGSYQASVNQNRDGLSALQATDSSIENVRLAQVRALEPSFPDSGLAVEVTDNLKQFWRLRDEPEVLTWLEQALALAEQTHQKGRQANVLQAIGDVQAFRKENDAALGSYSEALTLFKAVGDRLGQANVLLSQARLKNETSLFEDAIQLYSTIRDTYSSAVAKFYFALHLFTENEVERGLRILLEARKAFESINFESGTAAIDGILQQLANGDSSDTGAEK